MSGRCASNPTALEKEWASNACAPSFLDSREPSGRLKPVDDVEYTHPLAFLDNISLSNWALKGFDYVLGFNPLDRVSEFLVGDWQAVAKAGVAIGRAADALHDLGYNVQGGAIALRGGWEGTAADAAYQHFTGLAGGINDLVDPMREISKQFDSIAHGVYSLSEAATGWVKGMIDAAIIAGIAAAAGTVTAETGIGAVVGYGVAAYEVARILDLWGKSTAAMTDLYGAVQGAVGFIESQLHRLQSADLPDLSGYPAYRHPLAAVAN
nr:WXG100 family type VII secretion target [Planosporangium mesophilum]